MKVKHLSEIPIQLTSHGCGVKRVLVSNEETVSAITQIAETFLHKGDTATIHSHETMEEFFYVLEGEVDIATDSSKAICKQGDFITISPKEQHSLKAMTDCTIMTIGCAICHADAT